MSVDLAQDEWGRELLKTMSVNSAAGIPYGPLTREFLIEFEFYPKNDGKFGAGSKQGSNTKEAIS